jgi:predicted nucleotidyltransferase
MLEKLFTSRTRVKILNHLFFEVDETHIREIAGKLEIPVSGVKREVDNLEKVGIIKKKKTKISLNSKCNFLDDLRNIFVKSDGIVYPIAEAFTDIEADFVFLFGSFARGDYNEESDVDLMVVGDSSLDKIIKVISPVEKVIKKDINPTVWKLEEFKKNKDKGFVKDVMKKGIIMIKGDENELRKIVK